MMKSTSMLNGSAAGLAAVINVDTTVNFLSHRSQVIDLEPVNSGAYVWRRVFSRRR